jgi:hypothetical protein
LITKKYKFTYNNDTQNFRLQGEKESVAGSPVLTVSPLFFFKKIREL